MEGVQVFSECDWILVLHGRPLDIHIPSRSEGPAFAQTDARAEGNVMVELLVLGKYLRKGCLE